MKRSVLQPGVNDVATTYPEVATFWSPKNKGKPENFLPGSPFKILWECLEGHTWENVIRQEIKKEVHCKECAKTTPKPSVSLQEISKKYSIKNKKPFSETLAKTRKLLWDCSICSTEYVQTFGNELAGIGCPYCSGRKVKAGVNDIATLFPDLIQYWDERNDTSITQHGRGSQKVVLWKCPTCKGSWETQPITQVNKKPEAYCSYCSGVKLLSGVNDLQTKHPEKTKQFHSLLNSPQTAEMVLPTSTQVMWWRNGNCGHEWQQPIVNRVNSLTECPVCSGTTVVKGLNSLLDVKPYLAEYWDYDNNVQDPFALSPSSNMTIYLKCDLGHNWKTTPQRVSETITCQVCTNKQLLVGYNDLPTTHPHLAKQWHPTKNLPLTPQDVTAGTHTRINWICDKGHEWSVKGNDRVNYNSGCPECIPFKKSQAEDDLTEWIKSLGFIVQQHKRKIIGTELDIYIPEKQIAIEYNGIYWHTEKQGKHKTYHYNKWLACKRKGIQLIQIWEDDWRSNPSLIKKMVAHKLGVATQKRIFARKSTIKQLTQNQTETFLNANHIQGSTEGSIRVGLTINDELVAVMVLKKEPGTNGKTFNLLRYSTSENIIGGFTKLLKHVELTYAPESIVTFSDNCVSDGGLYKNSGFLMEAEIPPDYMYVVKNERKHKFGYRLKKFKNDPTLKYEEGLTERELAVLNNLPRIWDAGKTKWVKTINK